MANKNLIWCNPSLFEKDLTGKTYIITGANSGVGFETTQQLIKQGAHVVMAVRRPDATIEVSRSFESLKGSFEIIKCDLANLESVRSFVKAFKVKHNRLDGLACNAGMVNMKNEPIYTTDGFDSEAPIIRIEPEGIESKPTSSFIASITEGVDA